MIKKILLLGALALPILAGQPQLKSMKVSWSPYLAPSGCSNTVIVIYKSTSLGTVFTPYKPTAVFPASRTNGSFAILPGLYHFYATTQAHPLGESEPSNICTNIVKP